jgi:ADP-ribosylglycohydrolase
MGESDKGNNGQLSLADLILESGGLDSAPEGRAEEQVVGAVGDEATALAQQEAQPEDEAVKEGPDFSSWEEAEEEIEAGDEEEGDDEGGDDEELEDEQDGEPDGEDGDDLLSSALWKDLAEDGAGDEWADTQSVETPDSEDGAPSLEAIARDPRLSRLVGAVLGAAIGDAVGNPTEFITSFEAIRRRYPPNGVEGFVLYREGPQGRFAPFTDDTQMSEAVLRSLLWSRENDADLEATMNAMAKEFIEWANHPKGGHRAPGNACLSGCRALARGVHWSKAGGAKAGGCGSVMRAYPFGLMYADDLNKAESWAVAHSKLTHGDPIALAASAAMAVGIARLFRGESLSLVLSEMVAAACRYSARTAAMMARAIDEAEDGTSPEITLKRLEGWAAHEAIAAAVYLFARHPDDPRAAIIEAANTPGDSDSLATLVGALTGCRRGIAAIPADWIREIERADEFIALACRI